MNDPFPDKEEAGIVEVRDEAFAVIHDDDCNSLHEAKASPEWSEWKQAIETELNQLNRMGTWKLVEKPPSVVPIANKFVFAKKQDKNGNLQKYKARLVAKGCAQCLGYDFLEMHSPVIRVETIRSLLVVAAKRKLYIHQMDIKGAYLNSIVECAHTVASESVISEHMTAPELPKPDDVTQAMQSQHVEFQAHFLSSSSPRSSHFPHLPPSLSANQTQATYSQDLLLATYQASSAEGTRIAHIRPANNKPKDDTTPHCMCSALPSPTILRSGLIRKDSE